MDLRYKKNFLETMKRKHLIHGSWIIVPYRRYEKNHKGRSEIFYEQRYDEVFTPKFKGGIRYRIL